MKKIITLFIVTTVVGITGYAQLGTPLSQFSGNQMVYNPGYAGIYDLVSINLSVHKSWFGFKDSPQMINLNGHSPFSNQKHAWGWVFQNDSWGPLTGSFIHGNYSYKMYLHNGVLSLGFQGGCMVHTVNWDAVEYVENPEEDPFFEGGRTHEIEFDASVGIYYLAPQWYLGFSVMHLNNPKYGNIKINDVNWYSQMRSQFIMTAGINVPVSYNWSLRPQVFLRYVKTTPLSVNVGAHAYYDNRYSVGINFMTGQKGISFQAKAMITDQLRIGYSYDVFYGPIRPYQHGSHEISVNYLIKDVWKNARTVDLLWL
jgi:type IX secretion system PorP/SprF family membrane protein